MITKSRIVSFVIILVILSSWSVFPQQKFLAVTVVVPDSIPANDHLYIVGNDSSLGGWNPGVAMMKRENDRAWSFRIPFDSGSRVEFKITRGTWATEALFKQNTIAANIVVIMNNDTSIFLRPISWKDIGYRFAGGITGNVRYHRGVRSRSLLKPRDLVVWLPPSYEKDLSRTYPVLYMHDGENIVDPSLSFSGSDWRVDEVADSLIKANSIEEIIVVGIYNTSDRALEYSDTPLGKAYADFVVHTLKPMIDSTYRTKPDRKHTATMGSSSGGLSAFLFAWWYPEVFSEAGCLSSAFLVDSNKILRDVRAYAGPRKDLRIYLDVGSVALESRLKPGYDEMIEILLSKGYVKGKDLEYFYDEGAEHTERAWAHRLWRPLVFMFGK